MALQFPFDNSYARLPDRMFSRVNPTKAHDPTLLIFNNQLSSELSIRGSSYAAELAAIFSGTVIPEGADPLAQAYAGHQFGNFVPSLGDGRALLLGEVVDATGNRRDIQLKGSGRTPYSRGGDGRAWLGPVLREYVVSEAMHALGIPTTRALAAVTTGEDILRQEGAVPGAVLTRVASSHIRVGTFQYFAARGDRVAVETLFKYAAARHYPEVSSPLEFLNAVMARQAALVAKWMGVGFIHGVMNTDNTTISGETIDYGPCAFMDRYHPATVFSSIDRYGRYAYDKQRDIIVWNMAQLAGSLIILEENEEQAIERFTAAIQTMPALIEAEWLHVFGAKLGIQRVRTEDKALIDGLLSIMLETEADFTNVFRWLATEQKTYETGDASVFDDWIRQWQKRIEQEEDPVNIMLATNPARIPRNHRIEQMIQSALAGDMRPFDRLMLALSDPYRDISEFEDLAHPPEPQEEIHATFCGT